MLEQVQSCARKALADEQGVIEELRKTGQLEDQAERNLIQRSITKDKERIAALDRLVSRIYEDQIAGRIATTVEKQ